MFGYPLPEEAKRRRNRDRIERLLQSMNLAQKGVMQSAGTLKGIEDEALARDRQARLDDERRVDRQTHRERLEQQLGIQRERLGLERQRFESSQADRKSNAERLAERFGLEKQLLDARTRKAIADAEKAELDAMPDGDADSGLSPLEEARLRNLDLDAQLKAKRLKGGPGRPDPMKALRQKKLELEVQMLEGGKAVPRLDAANLDINLSLMNAANDAYDVLGRVPVGRGKYQLAQVAAQGGLGADGGVALSKLRRSLIMLVQNAGRKSEGGKLTEDDFRRYLAAFADPGSMTADQILDGVQFIEGQVRAEHDRAMRNLKGYDVAPWQGATPESAAPSPPVSATFRNEKTGETITIQTTRAELEADIQEAAADGFRPVEVK